MNKVADQSKSSESERRDQTHMSLTFETAPVRFSREGNFRSQAFLWISLNNTALDGLAKSS